MTQAMFLIKIDQNLLKLFPYGLEIVGLINQRIIKPFLLKLGNSFK